MHRIDTPDAVDGLFQDSGSPGTRVTDDWLNDVQENLALLIEGAGIALSKGDHTQLLDAIQSLAFRPGDYKMSAVEAAPTGWYVCDGSEKLISGDGPLYAAIGDQFGEAAEGYFKLPPGGLYMRALDNGSGNDPADPDIGDTYADQVGSHEHLVRHATSAGSGNDLTVNGGVMTDAVSSGTVDWIVPAAGAAETRVKTLIGQLLIKR